MRYWEIVLLETGKYACSCTCSFDDTVDKVDKSIALPFRVYRYRTLLDKNQIDIETQHSNNIITTRACAKGITIGLSLIVGTKIARSRDLGIRATRKHNESVELFGKSGFCMLEIVW